MPKFFPVGEEMKRRAALLENELVSWPKVKSQAMFGMLSFYRSKCIFAAVPRTRALASDHSIIIKFDPMPEALKDRAASESRLWRGAPGPGAGWHSFEIGDSTDLKDALWWLNQAYELAK
jgi:hypothetical protein